MQKTIIAHKLQDGDTVRIKGNDYTVNGYRIENGHKKILANGLGSCYLIPMFCRVNIVSRAKKGN
jgi:hypothetical protein